MNLQKLSKATLCAFLSTAAFAVTGYAQTTNLTSCETITASGTYSIPPHTDLHSTSGDCLVIAAPNVTIQTQVGTITGNNSGAGIHIKAGATGFQFEPFATTINNFDIGIQDDADDAFIGSDFGAPLCLGNQVYTGVFFNNVHGSVVDGAAMHPISNGILIRGGGGNLITGYGTDFSQTPGQSNGGPTDCSFEVIASDGDGIRIDGGSIGNHLYQANVTEAASDGAGIHITGNSVGNFMFDTGVTNSGTGLRVENGSTGNFFFASDITGNKLDLFDGNPDCDHNLWQVGNFKTDQPSCAR